MYFFMSYRPAGETGMFQRILMALAKERGTSLLILLVSFCKAKNANFV